MLTVSRSRKPDRADSVIAVAVAALGAAAILAPGVLTLLAPPCLFSLLLDQTCWGCGMTRAALAFLRGDFTAAWQFNRASLLVLPLLLALYARHLLMIWNYARRK
jgi:hypothetical protein